MKPPKNEKKGIQISQWKVGEADDFYSVDCDEDPDIVPSPPDDFDSDKREKIAEQQQVE